MDVIQTQAGDQASMLKAFRHVHNTILMNCWNDGIIGLFFMFAASFDLRASLAEFRIAVNAARLIYFAVVSGS